MKEKFSVILAVGGKSNSLGRANEVINIVLEDKSQLEELYNCLFEEDAWLRMRAADCLEKVCRLHPEWIEPYIDRFLKELTSSIQPSIQWHLAQMLEQATLTHSQKSQSIEWLTSLLSSKDVDWIVAANSMDTLAKFTKEGVFSKDKFISLLNIQLNHKSKAIIKRANKLLEEFK